MFNINFMKLFYTFAGTVFYMAVTSSAATAQISFVDVMDNVADSFDRVPGAVVGISYLIGIVLGVRGILKLREHVDNPNNVALRFPVIYLLIGGAMFALPTIVNAMINTIDPNTTSFNVAIDSATGAIGILGLASALANIDNFNQVFANLVYAMSNTPLLIYAFAYLAGIIMAVSGLLKLKEHVEDGNRVPLKTPIIRFLIGGALLTLPSIFNAIASTISPNYEVYGFLDLIAGVIGASDLFGATTTAGTGDANQILSNVMGSGSGFPTMVSALSYFLALVLGVAGLLKLKEHVEDERTPLREGVIRLLVSGALFALPVIFGSMYTAISGIAGVLDLFNDPSNLSCSSSGLGLGSVMCNIFLSTQSFPFFLTVMAYFGGTAIGVWSILQFQEHVTNPQGTKLWDPFSKMLVAGGLFSLPTIVTAAANTVSGEIANHTTTGFNDAAGGGSGGLDGMMANLMLDTYGPLTSLINWFGIIAGFVLIFIGITRLMKSAQEGARGPGGLGTIMTFLAGGALISFSPMVSSFTASLFVDPLSQTYSALSYTAGMDAAAVERSNVVISSIMRFVLLLGLISIMRGIFIIRGVAEGNSQASIMAGFTHIIGGALAVNLGGLITVFQNTLGISNYGITVSSIEPYIPVVTAFA